MIAARQHLRAFDRWRGSGLRYLLVGLLLLIAYATWQLAFRLNGAPDSAVVVAQCRADYARAYSARDSAIVDQRTPLVSREQAAAAMSCGFLRRVRKR